MRQTTRAARCGTLLGLIVCCGGRPAESPPPTAPVARPQFEPTARLDGLAADGEPSAPGPLPSESDETTPLPPRPSATDADGSPRPFLTAELSPPGGAGILGVRLTVLAAPPKVLGGLEPSYPATENEVAGVLISRRWYGPLAWEQSHGTLDGYEPDPSVTDSEPSVTLSGRVVRAPMELLVFGEDARWTATVPLLPCPTDPCPRYVSPIDSVVVVVAAGTAERLGIGKGWSIAVGG